MFDLRYSSLKVNMTLPPPERDAIQEYPDESLNSEIRKRIAQYCDLEPSNVMLSCGAAEAIELIAKRASSSTSVVLTPIIFLIPEAISKTCTKDFITIPWPHEKHGMELIDRVHEYCGRFPRVTLWIVSPNNPTGQVLRRPHLDLLLGIGNLSIVVDEAYFELAKWTVCDKIASENRLIVIRSFSKGFGLAGARIGYILSNSRIVKQLESMREPFRVSGVSIHYALQALLNWTDYDCYWNEVLVTRDQLVTKFKESCVDVVASAANFVTIQLPSEKAARRLVDICARNGIGILGGWDREFVDVPYDHVRLAVTYPFDTQEFSRVFLRFLSQAVSS